MGSHASCKKAICLLHLDQDAPLFSLAGFPRLGTLLPFKAKIEPSFSIGLNQIELGSHGSQDYKFYLSGQEVTHNFRNIIASYDDLPFYSAEARLNPDAGVSQTSFYPISETQTSFFPCRWELSLYLQFTLFIPFLKIIGRHHITLFNKDPLLYDTEKPLTGFPQFNGPRFVLKKSVHLYDKKHPQGPSVMRVGDTSQITPIDTVLYYVDIIGYELNQDNIFTAKCRVSLSDMSFSKISSEIILVPTRGVTLLSPEVHHATIGQDSYVFEFSGRVDEPNEEHLGVAIRLHSINKQIHGAGQGEFHIGSNLQSYDVVRANRATSRTKVTIDPQLHITEMEGVDFIWVAPHGIHLDDEQSLTPSFVAPDVTELTDIWFTLFVKGKDGIHRPYKFEYLISPQE